MAHIQDALTNGEVKESDYMTEYIQAATRDSASDFGKVRVQYYRKNGIPGRRYARRPAGQWMCKSDRPIAFNFPVGP